MHCRGQTSTMRLHGLFCFRRKKGLEVRCVRLEAKLLAADPNEIALAEEQRFLDPDAVDEHAVRARVRDGVAKESGRDHRVAA